MLILNDIFKENKINFRIGFPKLRCKYSFYVFKSTLFPRSLVTNLFKQTKINLTINIQFSGYKKAKQKYFFRKQQFLFTIILTKWFIHYSVFSKK